jgi:1-acyl-sn-glycerol-3-phosphate acyltransferase
MTVPVELSASLPDVRLKKTYYTNMTPLRWVLTPTIKVLFSGLASIHASGVEWLPVEGPVILAANHLTNFDVIAIQLSLPRPVYFMGKSELFVNPVMDYVFRNLGSFPVNRGMHDEWALSHAKKVLEKRRVLGMFPEGTRSKGKGLSPAKTGAARLALDTGCPIVPLAVEGTTCLLKHLPRRVQIKITLGEPICPQREETAQALTERFMYRLASLLPKELRGIYQ